MEIGNVCRQTDQFLAAKARAASPLLQAQMFEQAMAWSGNRLRRCKSESSCGARSFWQNCKDDERRLERRAAAPFPAPRRGAAVAAAGGNGARFQLPRALRSANPGTPDATFVLTMHALSAHAARPGRRAVLLAAATALRAQPSWQEEFAKMPLTEKVSRTGPPQLRPHHARFLPAQPAPSRR